MLTIHPMQVEVVRALLVASNQAVEVDTSINSVDSAQEGHGLEGLSCFWDKSPMKSPRKSPAIARLEFLLFMFLSESLPVHDN